MTGFGLQIMQYAWVVPNLEAAIVRWHATLGVGPFLVSRNLKIDQALHRGRPCHVAFSTAVAQSGSAQIELIEQHHDGPSAFRDTVPVGETRLHHVAIIADDYEATMRRYAHVDTAWQGRFGDVRFAYLDTSATLGAMLEILEDKPAIRAFCGAVRKTADRWDGNMETLIREL